MLQDFAYYAQIMLHYAILIWHPFLLRHLNDKIMSINNLSGSSKL